MEFPPSNYEHISFKWVPEETDQLHQLEKGNVTNWKTTKYKHDDIGTEQLGARTISPDILHHFNNSKQKQKKPQSSKRKIARE